MQNLFLATTPNYPFDEACLPLTMHAQRRRKNDDDFARLDNRAFELRRVTHRRYSRTLFHSPKQEEDEKKLGEKEG